MKVPFIRPLFAVPVPTKFARSLHQVGVFNGQPVFRVNWFVLERNKYAPWGRGSAT